jgi:hypothetical protein
MSFEKELEERLTDQVDMLFSELNEAFSPFFENIDQRGRELETLRARADSMTAVLDGEIASIRRMLD